MERWIKIIAIFLLGAGTSLFLNASLFQTTLSPLRTIEITQEATATGVGREIGESSESVRVKRVIDGDTIELVDGRRVRYLGLDTPEVSDPRRAVECFGREAKAENIRLVDGKTVRLEEDVTNVDRYGRLLRYVYVGDTLVNHWLVRQGFAHASTYPPDVKYQEEFREAEREAREEKRGLWGGCPPPHPTPATSLGASQPACVIKGNISTKGEKIYHLLGCGSYDKTVIDESVGERWFCSEAEAVSAGWRKAKNCP